MNRRRQVVVVGAGILGASVAWALHRRGVEDLLVVDAMGPASGASGVGAGILSHLAWDPLDVRLVARSLEVYRELAEDELVVDLNLDEGETTVPLRWHGTGSLTLVGEGDVDRARGNARTQRQVGADVEVLDPDDVRDLPGTAPLDLEGVALALHGPRDGWTLVTDAVRRLLGEAHVRGNAEVRWYDPVQRIEEGPTVALRGERRVRADAVVVAAGAWTPRLLEASGLPVPLQGYKAQLAVLDWSPPEAFPILHDTVRDFYARPEGPGKLLVGDGTDTAPHAPHHEEGPATRAFLEHVAEAVPPRIPGARTARPLRSWSGVEAATPDRHPLAGPDPRLEGLHLLAGGNGFGFMRAPALGEAVAAQVVGETPPIDVARYAPERFAERWDEEFVTREGFTL